MIGTPGSYFEKEEKFLRECVRKQHAKENEEWFFIIASSSRPKKLRSMVLFLVWWNGKSANALAPAFAIPLFRFRVSCSFGATSRDVLGMGLPED